MPVLYTVALQLLLFANAVGNQDDPGNRERQREQEMTEAILAYLKEYPQAMDTIEGIAEWWISRAEIRTHVTMLAKVLDQLTERGLLEEFGTGDDRRYRLRPGSHG
jgi:hypothetical protein